MRVVAVHLHYAPEPSGGSQLLTQLCEDLAAGGDEVAVVVSRLAGMPAEERLRSVNVSRVWTTAAERGASSARLADSLGFVASALVRIVSQRRPDVILALSMPPLLASAAAIAARVRRVPLVAWVHDVHPDCAIALGLLRERGVVARSLRAAATAGHRAARTVVAASESMADKLRRYGRNVEVVAGWADGAALRPLDHSALRRAQGLGDRFVALYAGNLGLAHDVSTLIDAARLLESSGGVLAFLGGGARRAEAERLSAGLGNVRFLPHQTQAELADALALGDVHLATLRAGLEGLVVPSKIYAALAVARPVAYVAPARCDLAQLIARERLGWTVAPGDAAGLAAALRAAMDDRALARDMGARARRLFSAHFDRPNAVARMRALLHAAAQS